MLTISRRVVIAGGSGFLGRSLHDYLLQHGWQVTILSRQAEPSPRCPGEAVVWDARTLGDWVATLEDAAAVVNFTGRSVDCLKTPDNCDEILRSRVESTRVLGQAMRTLRQPPPVWVQVSTAHIYGDPPTARCTEESALGYGLAPDVGRAWEQEFYAQLLPAQRGVCLRTGFVLGRDRGAGSGALQKLAWIARLGLGGRVGSGRQGMSWVHELDLHRVVAQAISEPQFTGIYNVTAPEPVSQVEFMTELRRAVGMPIGLPSPSWLVRIGAPLLFHTDPELALYGRYVLPARLLESGFKFSYPTLREALQALWPQAEIPSAVTR